MSTDRPFVLSIAGFDPSGGAGVLADIKTFENLHVQGLAVLTANTLQTENRFIDLSWQPLPQLLKAITVMAGSYHINAVKIGIVPCLATLTKIAKRVRSLLPNAFLVWDTVIKSTTAQSFITDVATQDLHEALLYIDLITPNYLEIQKLTGKVGLTGAKQLVAHTAVLLKGGHNPTNPGTDYLLQNNDMVALPPKPANVFAKHGSGCVLSSAIAAYAALNYDLPTACQLAKQYTFKFLTSHPSLIGHHV